MGRPKGFSKSCTSAPVALLDSLITVAPDDHRFYSSLGAYAGLGRKLEALEAARRGVELLSVERDASRGGRVWQLALVQAAVGEQDAALENLECLLSIPSDFSHHTLRSEPALDTLRDHRACEP